MVRTIQKIKFSSFLKNNRLAATMFKTEIISSRALEGLIDALEIERSKPTNLGRDRISIEDIFFVPGEELYMQSWIESEFKWREIAPGTDATNLIEKKAFIYREINSLLRTASSNFFVFSETGKDAWNFCNKIRELSTGRLNPKKLSISSKGIESILSKFDTVNFLKLKSDSLGIKSLSFRGRNITDSQLMEFILSQEEVEYLEVGGIRKINSVSIKFVVNSRGRFWIYAKPEELDSHGVHSIISEIEAAQSIEG